MGFTCPCCLKLRSLEVASKLLSLRGAPSGTSARTTKAGNSTRQGLPPSRGCQGDHEERVQQLGMNAGTRHKLQVFSERRGMRPQHPNSTTGAGTQLTRHHQGTIKQGAFIKETPLTERTAEAERGHLEQEKQDIGSAIIQKSFGVHQRPQPCRQPSLRYIVLHSVTIQAARGQFKQPQTY